MKKILGAALMSAALVFAGNAWALTDTIEAAVGNTVNVSDGEGNLLASYRLASDGTFTVTAADGTTTPGTWEETGGQICLTPTGGEASCSDIDEGHGVGDTWTATGADGSTISLTIVAGS